MQSNGSLVAMNEELKARNAKLAAKVQEIKAQMMIDESEYASVILTLDNLGHAKFKQGEHYDLTIATAMRQLFGSVEAKLRAAIPYVTAGGLRDFNEMLGSALGTKARIEIMFRFPERVANIELHGLLNKKYKDEISTEKIWFGYLGEKERGGLHAKVIIQDDKAAIVSSANWTGYSLTVNAEAGVLTRSQRAIGLLINWFDYLKQHSKGWSLVEKELGESS